MKLFPRELSDNNDNTYWRVKSRDEQAQAKAVGRQRNKVEQLAEDLLVAWKASEPKES